MKKLMIKLIKSYQKQHAFRAPSCKYKPTCSNYALDAYENYNFFYASLLTIWRLLRCNPFSKGGYDPIPKYKKELKLQLEEEKKNRIFSPE
ncbi:MAG: membrane protein insertion efficiency factor YidD [Candidatus Izemoplasmatales bacterium]|jgi:putative membrane protein insertion efficiency factor